jgi:hypothetical protein
MPGLQSLFANLWTFSMGTTSLLRNHFPSLNSSELHQYRLTCIVLLPEVNFGIFADVVQF